MILTKRRLGETIKGNMTFLQGVASDRCKVTDKYVDVLCYDLITISEDGLTVGYLIVSPNIEELSRSSYSLRNEELERFINMVKYQHTLGFEKFEFRVFVQDFSNSRETLRFIGTKPKEVSNPGGLMINGCYYEVDYTNHRRANYQIIESFEVAQNVRQELANLRKLFDE